MQLVEAVMVLREEPKEEPAQYLVDSQFQTLHQQPTGMLAQHMAVVEVDVVLVAHHLLLHRQLQVDLERKVSLLLRSFINESTNFIY
jgi:hypothetical protein